MRAGPLLYIKQVVKHRGRALVVRHTSLAALNGREFGKLQARTPIGWAAGTSAGACVRARAEYVSACTWV